MKGNIYVSPNEARIIQMALGGMIEDLNANREQPWTPEARKYAKEMLTHANSVSAKIERFTGIKSELPPYKDGDENEFFTKES